MKDNKDVLKGTENKDSNLEDKKGVIDKGSTEVFHQQVTFQSKNE